MAPPTNQVLLSPAELSYLHASLSLSPPIRPDARTPTQFRPLIAETNILPGTNGSARICFADGTEAVVGVKAEVEKSVPHWGSNVPVLLTAVAAAAAAEAQDDDGDGTVKERNEEDARTGDNAWVETTVDIPGFRDDDAMPVFLSALLNEALLADGEFTKRLWINTRFHWKLYIDVCGPLQCFFPFFSLF